MSARTILAVPLLASLAVVAACGSDSTGPSSPPNTTGATTELVSVTPQGGATGVSTTGPMTMTFSGPMMAGMEQYIDLHQGDVSGPTVPMACTWSGDRTTVTCTPQQPLQPNSPYTLHVGGGMRDADDHPADMGMYQGQNGGQWLMSGGTMGGTHAGMPISGMGAGWQAANGSYGMVFPFTTTG